ncbi:MAG: insulinase family protein [Gemmatimonadaceae bacterium]
MRALSTIIALVLLAAPAAAQFPTRPPAPLPLEPTLFPPFVEFELENGLRVVLVSSEKQPVLSLSLSVLGGATHDPAGKSGTADLVAGLLTKGAGTRSAEQIAADIERVGGSLGASAGQDFLTLNATVLRDDRELAFSLMADALLRPTFPPSELELLRTQSLSALALEKSQPDAIASRAFARALYGDHPYGRRPTEASVTAITRSDLVAFHASRVQPGQALLVIAGAIDSTEAHRLVEQSFGAWVRRFPPTPPMRPAPQRATSEILLVHRPGSVQSNILVGNTTWLPTDTRGYALALANQVLGGASDARLFQILREQKGWTYGAYSGVTRTRGLGYFSASAEVRTEVTDSALVELLLQVRRMGSEPLDFEEFERQKQTLVGRFPLQIETADQVAAQVARARLLGLATDYVQTYRERLSAVTREQAQAAARAGMRADAALIVVVGDGNLVRELLERIAPVTMVDVEGNPIAPTQPVAPVVVPSRPLEIDRWRMTPATDSFTVLVQGQAFGHQVSALERFGDGWQYTEQSVLGTLIQQQTTVRFSAAAAMWSVEQSGLFQGQELRLSVRYGDGTVTGEGITPGGQGGMQPVRYTAVPIPEGTVDDNALQALLPYFNWAPNASFTVAVFASGKGEVEQRTFRVVAEEVVSVPLGTFAAYRVSYTGGDAPGTYWIELTAPHRLLKFGPSGAPLEIVRVR